MVQSLLNQPSRNVIVKKYDVVEQSIKQLLFEEVETELEILTDKKAPGTDDMILKNFMNERKQLIMQLHNLINTI